jgi:tRNA-dihydrouridine synthase
LSLPPPLIAGQPWTVLAPMQDVTDLAFMRLLARRGAPDWYVTEYFRVHVHSTLEPHILASITGNDTGRPVFAQLIGEDIPHMLRTVRALLAHPIAGIDLNMGCPAPKVYRKNVGGGLLRDPPAVDRLLGALRAAIPGLFTVKMRLGFADLDNLDAILASVRRHAVDLLTVHGRTVRDMYRGAVRYDAIRHARASVPCPVIANGNVSSAARARAILAETGCAGVMIGRGAIRNPWIFQQCRAAFAGGAPFQPTLGDVRGYIDELWDAMDRPGLPDRNRLNRMKKFLCFVGQGVDAEGAFLHVIRRATEAAAFFAICDAHLCAQGRAALPFADEPYPGVVARPNHEAGTACG